MRYFLKSFLSTCLILFSIQSFGLSLQYAVIVDAGSSGSRAHVFSFSKSTAMIPLPVINDVFVKSTKPGLSSYANMPELAGQSLKSILDAAAIDLQNRGVDLSQVSIRVFATAGMRLLPKEQQEAIYASVRNYIHANYAFSLHDDNVQTITGMMEGVYGWLDVNYLYNNFNRPSTPTIGSIDMGGASTQIAFATKDTSKPADEIVITINQTPYRIFSQSMLGLGQNQALNAMTADPSGTSCYPTSFPIDSHTGDFIFSPCSVIYMNIIKRFNMSNNIISTADQPFIAYSGIFDNYRFFNITQTPTQSALKSRINAVCYLPWFTLQSNHPDQADSFLSTACANGVYFYDLLYKTYQLQDSQLTVADTINGTEINWTLGAMLFNLVH